MRLPYLILDVFTEQRFGGNPLAVLPVADGLDAGTMQRIAAELNLSETVFVTAAAEPDQLARLRIFTPRAEIPFAGHPTVGAAIALARLGRVPRTNGTARFVLGEEAGPVPVTVTFRSREPVRAEFEAPRAPERVADVPVALAAGLLGLPEAAIVAGPVFPCIGSCGTPFTIVEVVDRAALGTAHVADPALWREAANGVLVVTRDVATDDDAHWRARMYAPAHGIAEDPATGSAAAAFAGVLALAGGPRQAVIAQGVEMGRRSRIETRVEPAAADGWRVLVAGSAVAVAEGFIETEAG